MIKPMGPLPLRIEPVVLPTLTDMTSLPEIRSDVREAERYAQLDLSGVDLEFWSFTDCEFRQTGREGPRVTHAA